MSSQERQLVKASSSATGSVSCHVVGLLPPVVYEALQLHPQDEPQDSSAGIRPQGRLAVRSPRTPDGWSSLVLSSSANNNNNNNHMIYVWRQSTQTLSEPLVPASDKDVFQLQPPPHEESDASTSGACVLWNAHRPSPLVARQGNSIQILVPLGWHCQRISSIFQPSNIVIVIAHIIVTRGWCRGTLLLARVPCGSSSSSRWKHVTWRPKQVGSHPFHIRILLLDRDPNLAPSPTMDHCSISQSPTTVTFKCNGSH
eukprot:scaffold15311_cov43-Attheya_sp.AAC.2